MSLSFSWWERPDVLAGNQLIGLNFLDKWSFVQDMSLLIRVHYFQLMVFLAVLKKPRLSNHARKDLRFKYVETEILVLLFLHSSDIPNNMFQYSLLIIHNSIKISNLGRGWFFESSSPNWLKKKEIYSISLKTKEFSRFLKRFQGKI